MADTALSVATSSLAALLTGTTGDPLALSATAQPSDPFAALLANATGTRIEGALTAPTTMFAAMTAPLARSAMPAVSSTGPALPPLPADALPTALTVEEQDDDKNDAAVSTGSDDPLADAIASGATAVLALAPVIAPPVQQQPATEPMAPSPAPIDIDASIGTATIQPRRLAVSGRSDGHPFKQTASPVAAKSPELPADAAQAKADPAPSRDEPRTPQPPATISTPAATMLPPEMVKAVIAALKQGDAPPAAETAMILTTDAPAPTAPPPVDAKVPPSPASQQIQAEQAAPAQPPRRPANEEVVLPRHAGDARKRAGTQAMDAPSGAPHQRVAEPASLREPGAPLAKGDAVVEQTLTVARDGAWLDTLARDIASSAGNGVDLKFKLDPQNLGSLTVAISQSEDGASIRMTADNDTTRNLLIDAQPKLVAEARAQGLKVSDTHVDLKQDAGQSQSQRGSDSASQNQGQTQTSGQDASRWAQGNGGQNGTAQNGQNRQSSPGHQPFVSNLGLKADAQSESHEGDSDALYA